VRLTWYHSYQKHHIFNHIEIIAPITNLIKKNSPFIWRNRESIGCDESRNCKCNSLHLVISKQMLYDVSKHINIAEVGTITGD